MYTQTCSVDTDIGFANCIGTSPCSHNILANAVKDYIYDTRTDMSEKVILYRLTINTPLVT